MTVFAAGAVMAARAAGFTVIARAGLSIRVPCVSRARTIRLWVPTGRSSIVKAYGAVSSRLWNSPLTQSRAPPMPTLAKASALTLTR